MLVLNSGGPGATGGYAGEEGTVSGEECPVGLYGTFCEVNHIVQVLKCRPHSRLLSARKALPFDLGAVITVGSLIMKFSFMNAQFQKLFDGTLE